MVVYGLTMIIDELFDFTNTSDTSEEDTLAGICRQEPSIDLQAGYIVEGYTVKVRLDYKGDYLYNIYDLEGSPITSHIGFETREEALRNAKSLINKWVEDTWTS